MSRRPRRDDVRGAIMQYLTPNLCPCTRFFRQGSALLVRIILANAYIGIFAGHALSFEHITKPSVMRLVESISVIDNPIVNEVELPGFNSRDLFSRHRYSGAIDTKRHLHSWEKCCFFETIFWWGSVGQCEDWLSDWNCCLSNARYYNVISRSDAIIFSSNCKFLGRAFSKTLQIADANPDVSAKLAFFTVICGEPLLARVVTCPECCERRKYDENKDRIFKPVLIFGLGAALVIGGCWVCYFTARRCGPRWLLIGTLALGGGGLVIVFHDVLLSLAENASASLGFGASAPCYRGAEDVGIVAIVVPKLELRDVERKIFAADLMETAHDAALQRGASWTRSS